MIGAELAGPVGLVPGTAAPDFTLSNQHGERMQMSALHGAPVLLVFYPYAFSGICSGELAELNAALPQIQAAGAHVTAVSVDTMYALRVFADQLGLEFDLLSDFWPHGSVSQQYDVFDEERGCAVRGSFLVNANGVVAWQMVHDLGSARDIGAHIAALSGASSSAE